MKLAALTFRSSPRGVVALLVLALNLSNKVATGMVVLGTKNLVGRVSAGPIEISR